MLMKRNVANRSAERVLIFMFRTSVKLSLSSSYTCLHHESAGTSSPWGVLIGLFSTFHLLLLYLTFFWKAIQYVLSENGNHTLLGFILWCWFSKHMGSQLVSSASKCHMVYSLSPRKRNSKFKQIDFLLYNEIEVTLYTFMSWYLNEQVNNITLHNMSRKHTPISLFTDYWLICDLRTFILVYVFNITQKE